MTNEYRKLPGGVVRLCCQHTRRDLNNALFTGMYPCARAPTDRQECVLTCYTRSVGIAMHLAMSDKARRLLLHVEPCGGSPEPSQQRKVRRTGAVCSHHVLRPTQAAMG